MITKICLYGELAKKGASGLDVLIKDNMCKIPSWAFLFVFFKAHMLFHTVLSLSSLLWPAKELDYKRTNKHSNYVYWENEEAWLFGHHQLYVKMSKCLL